MIKALTQFVSKLLLIALLITAVGPLEVKLKQAQVEAEFEDGAIRASTLNISENYQLEALKTASVSGMTPAYEYKATFLSEVLIPDFSFDAVGIEWKEHQPEDTDLELLIRFQTEEGAWTSWQEVDADIDSKDGSDELREVDQLMPTQRSKALQYKVYMLSDDGAATPRIQNLKFHYIDASVEEPTKKKSAEVREVEPALQKSIFADQNLNIIPRSHWGADETFRLSRYFGVSHEEEEEVIEIEDDSGKNGEEKSLKELYPEEFEISHTVKKDKNGDDLYWPQEYAENVNKIVVHHTASTKDLDNPKAAIRSIYYYHSVRRGWGDIGYNYIIDTDGRIYEGRAGGERVVAGHARGFNTGSIGIAVLGNYQESAVPYEVLDSLGGLIKDKTDTYNIRSDSFSRFRGEVSANVMGHRDNAHTLCPGENLYDALPVLRKLVANNLIDLEGRLGTQLTDEPYEFVSVSDYDTIVLDPESAHSFKLKIKNIGTETWGKDTYLVADKNENADRMVHIVKQNGNASSISGMKESSVAPGETATFNITIEAKLRGGFENYRVTPLFNGKKKTRHYLDLPIYVAAPDTSYDLISLNINSTRVKAGEAVKGTLKLRNTGNIDWERSGVNAMQIKGPSNETVGTLKEAKVVPGGVGTFSLNWVPEGGGSLKETLSPSIKSLGKIDGPRIRTELTVYDSVVQAKLVSMTSNLVFDPGQRKSVTLQLKNTGNKTWHKNGRRNGLNIGKTHHPDIKVTRPLLSTTKLKGGNTGTVRFSVKAPEKPGSYTVYLRPRLGVTNLMKDPIKFEFMVSDNSFKTTAPTIAPTTSTVSPTVAAPAFADLDEEIIRIRLGFEPAQFGDPVVTANGDFDLYLDDEQFLSLKQGDKVEVRRTSGKYQILFNSQAWVVMGTPRFIPRSATTIMEVDNYEKRPSWNTSLNDNRFRGTIEVREINTELNVINELTMMDYLKGIGEVENAAPTEKIRTMMILARSYARYYLTEDEKFPGMPYHLSDNPDESQKYLGFGFEERGPNIAKAVRDTRGKVVTYKGKIIKTPYFNTSDGTSTKSALDVWGWSHTPYLVSVPDPLCDSDRFRGHGVGLSGCGATQAALAGHGYEAIIQHYYTGVEVEVR
jgi:hypothetical protein